MTLPASVERTLFAGLFRSLSEEMMSTLVRTAYSANIKERRDCSTALFGPEGEMIAQAAAIPVHLGAMPLSVEAARNRFADWAAGDVVLLNDPFRGGTHLPDLTLVSPVFTAGRSTPAGFLASRAHHADIGGTTPGSMPISQSIDEEGVRFPPVRLFARGEPVEEVWDRLLSSVRTPEERRGDLRAQVAAHRVGARRFGDLVSRYGLDEIVRQAHAGIAYAERLMRSTIAATPDGRYDFEDVLDGDGLGTVDIRIRVEIEIIGERARVDFAGSDPPCRGGVNAVRAVTVSAVRYCFLCLSLTPSGVGHGEPDSPINEGVFRPIEIHTPRPSIVDAVEPSAVAAGNVETSQRIVDVVFGALAQAVPDVVPAASQGTMNNVTLGGSSRDGSPFAMYETIGGGAGGGPWGRGASGRHSHMTNTWNTPAEALEYAYPLRIERYSLRSGSGGAGLSPGGDGVVREIRALAPVRGTLLAERRRHPPHGAAGGKSGVTGRDSILRGDNEIRLESKTTLELDAGDVLRVETPGGGGWRKSGRPEK